MISIKSNSDIVKMRKAGQLTAKLMQLMQQMAIPGMTTLQMDSEAEKFIRAFDGTPSFKNYNGFPSSICASVDDVVVHGIPSARPLREGELLSVDVGVYIEGFHGDMARTFAIGQITAERRRLIDVTEESFFKGLQKCMAGARLGDISQAIQYHAESRGFSVVRSMTGHGIGRALHEDPVVANYGKAGSGILLKSGYTLAIEPMINMGTFEVYTDKSDGWTCRTRDGQPSAHYENTVLITDGEPEILTKAD